ncbi:MAG: L-threonylcarbamoyladenylate synthase, partial [Actinomycetota bacterium]
MSAKILRSTDSGAIKECVDALTRSELVAVPTETVYGLAALATDKVAIKKIFSVKSR